MSWETKQNMNQYAFSGNYKVENESVHYYTGLEAQLVRTHHMGTILRAHRKSNNLTTVVRDFIKTWLPNEPENIL